MKKLILTLFAVFMLLGCGGDSDEISTNEISENDQVILTAYENRVSDLQVTGEGTVIVLLENDTSGSQHQKFIIELSSGQTLLISHNIDLAPIISSLKIGDAIEFYGEYEWNDEGGLIHWTHIDPNGNHISGWLFHDGTFYG
jgi:calcineurin-like phosphoesterase family protein